jgi:hypothetical protein
MAETMMPEVGGDGERRSGVAFISEERVEVARAIGPHEDSPGCLVLHREAKRVKLDRTPIITGKRASADQVLNNVRGDKNVIKVEGARGEVSSARCNNGET